MEVSQSSHNSHVTLARKFSTRGQVKSCDLIMVYVVAFEISSNFKTVVNLFRI